MFGHWSGRAGGTRESDEAPAQAFEGVVPADFSSGGVEAKEFAAGGGKEIVAVEEKIDEVGAFERALPHFLAGDAVEGEDVSFNADEDELVGRCGHEWVSFGGIIQKFCSFHIQIET